ncbi:S1C family serine protease [Paenibacillus arenilitoris]|uniref:Trypsin-like peptidase domain-containing protein n=1 Tax=Paenibacillus arenilitoris TaxID=2772299 RepID=A0A927CR22_9BACL|nr:trypsin-like peptidase domain-containing protein [Paenibacillus arenilitoris]MBD2871253.1 trypsin-like peptidase domain-containing protein [Paenibacillus arenilitoris]
MRKRVWASVIASALILCGGMGAAYAVHTEVPKRLGGKPLLAASPAGGAKTLKDIIFETQKLVVMIKTENGSQGSGFLYNLDGDLITNAHVVSGARKVTIKTADARELDGEVIGISTETDVAVVRVPDLAGTEPLRLVREEEAEVGDEVLAVGSPLGFQNTVTTGIISGLGRSFEIEPYLYSDLYQISAPIAPGNSGGPLVDRKTGEVIGINSAGYEQGSIGFSIPIANVIGLAEGWSEEPMAELPEAEASDDSSELAEESAIDEMAGYLVSHFYDSLNNADYVYAYSLLGGNWKEGTSYEKFREGYLGTRNVVIDDMHVSGGEDDRATVIAVLSVDERVEGEYVLSKYQVTYEVGYENDQLKLLSGKGKAIK